jgi:hypothetical protein
MFAVSSPGRPGPERIAMRTGRYVPGLTQMISESVAGFPAPCQQGSRPQQVISALGKEALELGRAPVGCHPVSSRFSSQSQTMHEEPGANVPAGSKKSQAPQRLGG